MDISNRLKMVAELMDKCDSAADVGTDHGYIPIYLIRQNKCNKIIASDINKGPVMKARLNVSMANLEDKIECRLGPGLSVLKPGEVNSIIISGMGGNLIRDIIEQGKEVFKAAEQVIVQPVQNPEVFRRYAIESGYSILDEELCFEENKYYEIIKLKYNNVLCEKDNIFYEISEILLKKKHPLIKLYINEKLRKYNKVYNSIKENTALAQERKSELMSKIRKLEELVHCL